jgi:hypothetical protein
LNKLAKKHTTYPIEGEPVTERKRAVQRLLKRLGCEVSLQQITQTRGVLSIRWEPPITDQFLHQMETFARYGAVYFGPHPAEAKLAYIDLVFEREPGLFMDDLILRIPVILESLDRLPDLLARYVQSMQAYERREAHLPEPEVQPEQQSLW